MRTLIILGLVALSGCASAGSKSKHFTNSNETMVTRDSFCQSLFTAFKACAGNPDLVRGVIEGALISEEVGKTYDQLSDQELAELHTKAQNEVNKLKQNFLDPEFVPNCQQSMSAGKIDQQRYDFVAPKIHGSCNELGAGVFLFVHGIVGEFVFSG
ncbi:MAG: hypothetical protein JW841_08755 [Deltaproteobacteria bacterium]|nr:hypothetical protein [Deltaproteobacteria bacterium]